MNNARIQHITHSLGMANLFFLSGGVVLMLALVAFVPSMLPVADCWVALIKPGVCDWQAVAELKAGRVILGVPTPVLILFSAFGVWLGVRLILDGHLFLVCAQKPIQRRTHLALSFCALAKAVLLHRLSVTVVVLLLVAPLIIQRQLGVIMSMGPRPWVHPDFPYVVLLTTLFLVLLCVIGMTRPAVESLRQRARELPIGCRFTPVRSRDASVARIRGREGK